MSNMSCNTSTGPLSNPTQPPDHASAGVQAATAPWEPAVYQYIAALCALGHGNLDSPSTPAEQAGGPDQTEGPSQSTEPSAQFSPNSVYHVFERIARLVDTPTLLALRLTSRTLNRIATPIVRYEHIQLYVFMECSRGPDRVRLTYRLQSLFGPVDQPTLPGNRIVDFRTTSNDSFKATLFCGDQDWYNKTRAHCHFVDFSLISCKCQVEQPVHFTAIQPILERVFPRVTAIRTDQPFIAFRLFLKVRNFLTGSEPWSFYRPSHGRLLSLGSKSSPHRFVIGVDASPKMPGGLIDHTLPWPFQKRSGTTRLHVVLYISQAAPSILTMYYNLIYSLIVAKRADRVSVVGVEKLQLQPDYSVSGHHFSVWAAAMYHLMQPNIRRYTSERYRAKVGDTEFKLMSGLSNLSPSKRQVDLLRVKLISERAHGPQPGGQPGPQSGLQSGPPAAAPPASQAAPQVAPQAAPQAASQPSLHTAPQSALPPAPQP